MRFAPIEELGKGIWFMLHFNAKHATTPKLKEAYRENVKLLAANFPCAKCQPHFQKFLDEHPLILFDHILNEKGEDIGYFQWSVLCHNKVNKFLNKYIPSFEEAYNFFYLPAGSGGAEACTQCAPLGPLEPRTVPGALGFSKNIKFQEIANIDMVKPAGLLKPAMKPLVNQNTFLIPHKNRVLSPTSIKIVGPDK